MVPTVLIGRSKNVFQEEEIGRLAVISFDETAHSSYRFKKRTTNMRAMAVHSFLTVYIVDILNYLSARIINTLQKRMRQLATD